MKKILLGLGAAGITLAMIPLFAAFEAHVVNVTATIENAMSVPAEVNGLAFGTVFPEEWLHQPITLGMSTSFIAEPKVSGLTYMIRQKPKCGVPIAGTNPVQYSQYVQVTEDAQGIYHCPEVNVGQTGEPQSVQSVALPMLCPFLSKHSEVTASGYEDGAIDAFHGPLTNWTLADTIATEVRGSITKTTDETDTWDIDLKVPCFKGQCAQDNFVPAAYQLTGGEHELFGCDLWVETTGIVRP